MPIEFACSSCGKRLRVKDESAGKRVKCPGCQTVLRVPGGDAASGSSAGGSSAGGSGPSAVAANQWYAKTGDGQTYGPVTRQELDQWANEGRLTSESQVLREGSQQWQWATDLYPHLAQVRPVAASGGSDNPFAFIDTGGGGGALPTGYSGGVATPPFAGQVSDKSKIAAGLLGLLLGSIGVHRFYLGFTGIGILQIVVTIATCGIGGWWGIIEGIMILVGSMNRDAQGRILRD
jgi:TM2 domain-containing membrane protein YozV